MVDTIVNRLEWDSDFFNLEIGEIELPNIKEGSVLKVNEKFDLLYIKSKNDINIEITGYQKKFQEQKIIFRKQLLSANFQNNNIKSFNSIGDLDLIDDLYELAFESGKFSRFKLDKAFSQQQFEALYRKWVDNSLNKKYANEFLIYKVESKLVGFVTYKKYTDFACIGLIATHHDYQGKGIGTQLIKEVERKLFDANCYELRIPTQESNQQASKFYSKLDYNILEKITIKHFWNHDTI
jgi:dTDP-4-amino-4,6-dideoxy-D-galactose acyltransferase